MQPNDATTAPGATVAVDDVSMVYQSDDPDGLTALKNINVTLEAGTFCSIVGPSGCGKSTLLMLIAGLYRATSGTLAIDGTPITAPWDDLGMVFQRDALLEWRSILDNVLLPIEVKRLGKKAYAKRALDLLSLVGLEGFDGFFPEKLSGGMRQRVAICRALIHEPRLLLMDEPFAAVDALTRERLNFDLLRLTGGRSTTVVFVTHSIDEAVILSDRILVMGPRPGRIIADITSDLPEPRTPQTKSSPRFHQLVDEIRDVFYSMGLV